MPGQRGGRTAGGTGLLPLRAVLPHALRTRECQFWPHCPALQNATSNISLAYVAPYTNASLDQVRRSGLPGTPAVLSPASIFSGVPATFLVAALQAPAYQMVALVEPRPPSKCHAPA